MSKLQFIFDNVPFPVEWLLALRVCDVVVHSQTKERFHIESNVMTDVLQFLISAIEGERIELKKDNIEGISDLCKILVTVFPINFVVLKTVF
jgi:hypothetical protein